MSKTNANAWLQSLAFGENFRVFIGASPAQAYPAYKIKHEGWEVWTAWLNGIQQAIISAPGVRTEYFQRISDSIPDLGDSGGVVGGGMGQATSSGPGQTPTMANPPQITGGGSGLIRSPNQVMIDLPSSAADWQGLETLLPDNRLPATKSPRVVNWDRRARFGSRCVRRGTAKLDMDIGTVNDGAEARGHLQAVAKALYAPSADWFQFILPNGDTHAFWFDTTGADTQPAGSAAADDSDVIDISGATSAGDVAALIVTAVNTAAIGLTALELVAPGVVRFTTASLGDFWRIEEFVADAGFTVEDFAPFTGAALSSEYRGLGLLSIPANGVDDTQLFMAFRDKDVDLGAVVGAQSATSLHNTIAGPLWGRPPHLDGLRGPDFTLTKPGGGVVRVTAEFLSILAANLKTQTVKAITIRYMGPFADGEGRYPLDPDEPETRSTILVRRAAYNGTSTAFDTPVLSGTGRMFFTVWAHALLGTSEPARGSITL